VHDHPDAVSRLVGSMLLQAIVEHVWVDPRGRAGAADDATSASWREGAECRSA
jgi:hypothetical protein